METKNEKSICLTVRLSPELSEQFDKIFVACDDKTVKTKSDAIRLLISNEYARLEKNSNDVVEIKQTEISNIDKKLEATLKLTDSAIAEIQKVLSSTYIINKNLLRNLFFTSRTLFTKLNMTPEELEQLNDATFKQAGQSMAVIENIITGGLHTAIQYAKQETPKK